MRFLSKSHIHSKNISDRIYGCVFCLQHRQTTHPNDATIFFSQHQLFAHLARHPRPLPYVPGFVVIQADDVPTKFSNNYDLHFSRPPRPTPLAELLRELASLPTAIASQTCRPTLMTTMRRPTDGAKVLSFAEGARILGVDFPPKYHGEWCIGWADHERGLIPSDAIRLDAPREGGARAPSPGEARSNLSATARWKFCVKEGREKGSATSEWLSFGKGEVISNIVCELSIYHVRSLLHHQVEGNADAEQRRRCVTDVGPHQEHWCWWGTNSKGKSGIFPRSHIEPGSLTDAATSTQRASMSSNERASLLSRFSIRNLRSSGSSGGGGETAGGVEASGRVGRNAPSRTSIY